METKIKAMAYPYDHDDDGYLDNDFEQDYIRNDDSDDNDDNYYDDDNLGGTGHGDESYSDADNYL
jgi:hypothetical protein